MADPGMDTSVFPGLAAMAWLRANTNLTWTGFYLGPAPSHPQADWMPHRAALREQGWGLAPLFVGQEVSGLGSHVVTAGQGRLDGIRTAQLMVQAGFARRRYVYLDLETPDSETAYLQAWAFALSAAGYYPGVYCSHLIAAEVAALLPGARIWAFRIAIEGEHPVSPPFSGAAPSGSTYPAAYAWQHDQNAVIECDGASLVVDLSTALGDPASP
jgi:hypothetical protein